MSEEQILWWILEQQREASRYLRFVYLCLAVYVALVLVGALVWVLVLVSASGD